MFDDQWFEKRCRPREFKQLTLDDGSLYVGEVRHNSTTREGKGVWTTPGGSVYEGYWLDDKWEHKGRMIFTDGSFYEGHFFCGKPHGLGKTVAADGTICEGYWEGGKPHGECLVTYTNGESYRG